MPNPRWISPVSSPRCSKRKNFCKKDKNNNAKNPYSKRGLDKFTALLAQLHQKRRTIYSQMGSDPDHEPLVRFVFNNSDDCVPIVVNLKDRKQDINNNKDSSKPMKIPSSDRVSDEFRIHRMVAEKGRGVSRMSKWRRPSYYLPVIMILMLLFLVLFGRSAAIMSTCIGWYVVPALQGEGSSLRSKKNIESTESRQRSPERSR